MGPMALSEDGLGGAMANVRKITRLPGGEPQRIQVAFETHEPQDAQPLR